MRPLRLVVLAFVGSWLLARPVWADPPGDDEEPLRPGLRDPVEREASTPSLELELAGAAGVSDARTSVSLGLMLTGTFDDLFVPSRLGARAEAAKELPESGSSARPARSSAATPEARTLAPVSGALARGAVRAARAAAREEEQASRLDDLSTRARASGAVPEVRFRVARVVDEGQSLSPTEYDPERVTATGGTSLWLEGRATFQLDRLVFAPDEIAVERLRVERARLDRELVREVLAALDDYASARAKLEDPASDEPARARGEVALTMASARLDVLTDGWFAEHAETRPEHIGPREPQAE